MKKCIAFTIDLEADHAGCVDEYRIFQDQEKINDILSTLNSLDVKITVFVVGEIFKLYPNIIKLFEKYNCEFEVHSFSHKKTLSDSEIENEIKVSKNAYIEYFKKNPTGYRVPHGKISLKTLNLIEKHGFLYDSSIFPSYYPNPLLYLFCRRMPHFLGNSRILEIPCSSITPFRITLSLSYLKLLGYGFFETMFKIFKLPDIICFNAHLHDFIFNKESYLKLSPFWKFIYVRNKDKGVEYCVKFIKYMKMNGYQFCFMSGIYNFFTDKN
jgi:hypothetical protein